jgi:hypothetical protein
MEHWNGVLDWSAGGHDEYLWNYSLEVLPCQCLNRRYDAQKIKKGYWQH